METCDYSDVNCNLGHGQAFALAHACVFFPWSWLSTDHHINTVSVGSELFFLSLFLFLFLLKTLTYAVGPVDEVVVAAMFFLLN